MNQALSGFADNQRLQVGEHRTRRGDQQVEQGQPADGIQAALHSPADQKMVDYTLEQQRLNQQSTVDYDYAQTGENELEGVRGGQMQQQLDCASLRLFPARLTARLHAVRCRYHNTGLLP
ncbi:hypothetical protein D3C75_679660 [compost metagenome]